MEREKGVGALELVEGLMVMGYGRVLVKGGILTQNIFSFVVGDGSRILFRHDKWTRDVPLKILYPQLFLCLANKEACIYEVLSPSVGDNDKVWSLRFYKEFND